MMRVKLGAIWLEMVDVYRQIFSQQLHQEHRHS